MRVLVTGAGVQLGTEFHRLLPESGHDTLTLPCRELNIADPTSVERAFEEHSPEPVINAAAHSGVDACEKEPEAANALGPRNLAVACERGGCDLLHVSTNYVFDGASQRPYEPFDPPNPINVYGRTKQLASEEYVKHFTNRWYIVRTAGVYGEGDNFVRTMLRLPEEREEISVKDDEYISPTAARDVAAGTIRLVESGGYRLYHLTNMGPCLLARVCAGDPPPRRKEDAGASGPELGISTPRPSNGVLSALGSPKRRHWREALAEYLRR